jgi:hypothetical protein
MSSKKINCCLCNNGEAAFAYSDKMEFVRMSGKELEKVDYYKCGTCGKIIWRFSSICDNVSCETSNKKGG